MAATGKFRILLLADGATKTHSLSASRTTLIAALAIGGVVAVGAVLVVARLLAGGMTAAAMAQTLEENRQLRSALTRIGDKLEDLRGQLRALAAKDDQLRLLADLPRIDPDTREVGVGGIYNPPSEGGDDPRRLLYDLDKLEREVRLQFKSFSEIERQFAQNRDLLAHTPSIRPCEGGYISSGFGRRRDPFTGRQTPHNGIDISVERGTPVAATADGRVVFAKRTPGLGLLVIIDHGYGFRTAYGHLSSIKVYKDQTVQRGQKIGEVGNTGRSTAPHLHYEVHVLDSPVDPLDYIFEPDAAVMAVK